jgi:hypothetical protein
MTGSTRARIVATWLFLVVATLLSWESAQEAGQHRLATSAVVLIAFAKVRCIGLEFMELRTAPRPLRLAFEAWLVAVCSVLLALYWLSPAPA